MKKNVIVSVVLVVVMVVALSVILSFTISGSKDETANGFGEGCQTVQAVEDLIGINSDTGAMGTPSVTTKTLGVNSTPPHAAFGDEVVYQDVRIGNDSDIFVYDISSDTETQITNTDNIEIYPDINEDYIVWCSYIYDGQRSVKLYDRSTSTTTTISANDWKPNQPVLYEDYIIWTETLRIIDGEGITTGSQCRIVYYDMSSSTRYNLGPYDGGAMTFDADGDYLVWNVNGNGLDVMGCDMSTNTQFTICNANRDQYWPKIDGNYVVWEDHRNNYNSDDPNANPPVVDHDYGDIYGYDLSTSTEFVIDNYVGITSMSPTISDGNCSYLCCTCGDITQPSAVCMTPISFPITPPFNPVSTVVSQKSHAHIDDNFIVWADFRNNQWDAYGYSISDDVEFRITNTPNSAERRAFMLNDSLCFIVSSSSMNKVSILTPGN
jgi:beta propeller repeat protein